MKLKKGDEVSITAGKDRGKRGKIEAVFPKRQAVLVAGVNIYKRHLKPRGPDKPGGIIDITKPLNLAKVALVCPKCARPTRIGYQRKGVEKLRFCKKCGALI